MLGRMGTKSRERIYGLSVLAAAERAKEARKQADRLSLLMLETSACWALRDRRSHHRRWATRLMPGSAIWK